jgi:glutamate synthase (NADPH/NADH) small chain
MNADPPSGSTAKYAWREVERVDPPKRPVASRVADFGVAGSPYDEATARGQASRCVQCPNPACVTACPLETPLVELLALTADGQFKEAAELLFSANSLPEIASHVCVGGRLCEAACVLGGKADPVPVRSITRFLLDYGWKHGLAEPALEPAKGQRIAVIGSGIGGLTTAEMLSRRGYTVTVFDCRLKPGGRVMNGLPGFRMDKELVERRVELLRQRGIQFRMGITFGRDVKLADLRHEFDAVFLGFGLADPVPLGVPGSELRGVYQAFPFVCQSVLPPCSARNRLSADQAAAAEAAVTPSGVKGRRVLVLGGGDTAMDVLRIAIRRGAADALCVYRRDEASLPADAEEHANAREEGARFLFLTQPVAVIGNAADEVTHVRCVRMELTEVDLTGRRGVKPVAGSEFDVPADTVFVAYGFTAPKLPDSDDFARLAADNLGRLVVDENRMTNFPGVFAGGSIVRGPAPLSDVVRDARQAANAIDKYLTARRPSAS